MESTAVSEPGFDIFLHMGGLELVLLLLAASAGLRVLADRLGLPYSALLVVGGLIIALMPNLPRVELAPDVLFLIFVPPLLYWGAVSFPLRDFRRELGPILRLAVIMVLVSTTAVAALAHAMDPAFTWAAAFTLGAIVSPPDPVAVLSLMRSPNLRAPRPIESILEGEGLLNDATALVTYRIAVAAAVTGSFSPLHASWQFLTAAAGGLVIGIAVGIIVTRLHRLTRSVPVAENTVSLLTPFAAFLPADFVGASGVMAVVAAGMYIARQVADVGSPETRLQNQSMASSCRTSSAPSATIHSYPSSRRRGSSVSASLSCACCGWSRARSSAARSAHGSAAEVFSSRRGAGSLS
jgi:CPA1 family monovalent cation:H+ antiporter